MPTSDARIAANQKNALLSTGPKSPEGKARSRGNALKHGLTGDGVVLPDEDSAEVDRLQQSFEADLKPSGEFGRVLVRRMALMSVRMERSIAHDFAHLCGRVRQAEADFDADWPEVAGEADPVRDRLRVEAAQLAMFDPSREATLARKYEAAAERCFFRSLKEFRQVERAAKANRAVIDASPTVETLGSFLPAKPSPIVPDPKPAAPVRKEPATLPKPVLTASKPVPMAPSNPVGGVFELPFSIGRVG